MKGAFYSGIALLILFELANVYFVMPMPYSQRWNSIDIAYALYSSRWVVRGAAGLLIGAGLATKRPSWGWHKWVAVVCLLAAAAVVYAANRVFAADAMFLQPATVRMEPSARNSVARERLVMGVLVNGEARAYPIQFLGYHHQVRDTIAGQPIMVTFCTVCRTGRVFSPIVDGAPETFRLAGMDHFNAMFEDATTGSWWRQATGEAIAGPRRGKTLAGMPSEQMTLAQWLNLHPDSLISRSRTQDRRLSMQRISTTKPERADRRSPEQTPRRGAKNPGWSALRSTDRPEPTIGTACAMSE